MDAIDNRGAAPLSAAEVRSIIDDAIAQANSTRAAIRLPLEARACMVLAVADTNGELLGLFRMPDALSDAIDVCPAKSRTSVYTSSPTIDPVDTLDMPATGDVLGEAFPPGTAMTNRTLGFGGQPFFPSGIDGTTPGPFRRVFNKDSGEAVHATARAHQRPAERAIFFPGGVPLYRNGVLVGGFGFSGDGVEQDDLVASGGTQALPASSRRRTIRADQVFVRGVRLPYLKFNRNPSSMRCETMHAVIGHRCWRLGSLALLFAASARRAAAGDEVATSGSPPGPRPRRARARAGDVEHSRLGAIQDRWRIQPPPYELNGQGHW